MKKLMNRSNITNAVCAAIMAAALLPAAPAGEALAAGGADRGLAPTRSGRDVQYAVVEIQLPEPWTKAEPYAMNEQGQIVGEGRCSGDDRAFLWDDGEMTNLGVLPGDEWSRACDINSAGVIVGWSYDGFYHPVAWVDGEIIDLGDGTEGWALAINNQGSIVGWSQIDGDMHAVIGDVTGWQVDIGAEWPGEDSHATAINEEGIVVGWVEVSEVLCFPRDSFVWDDGEATLLWQFPPPESYHYIPCDVNEARCIVGEKRWGFYMECAMYASDAWQSQDGEGVMLPSPDSAYEQHAAHAINDAGDMVGTARDEFGEYSCGVLWRDGVAYDLNDLIDPEGEWHIEAASDIDSRGRILAYEYPHPLLLLPIKPGDIDGDGDVDTADLLALLGAWGECEACPEDIDGNGVVNTADLLILLGNWG